MGRPNRGSAPTSCCRAARTITGRWSISPDEAHEESDELDGPVGRKPPHQHDWRRPAPIRSWRSSPTLLAPAPAKHAQFDDPPPKIDAPRLTDTVVMRPLGRVRRSWAGEHSVACQRRGSPEHLGCGSSACVPRWSLRLGRTSPLVALSTCRPVAPPHVTTAELHGAAAGHVHRTCHRCTQQASKRRESGRSLLASAQGHISLKAGGGSRAALALTRAASSESDRTRGVMPMWRVTPWTQKIEKAAPRRARARPPPGPHAAGRQGRRAMTRFEPTVPRSLVFVSLNK